ncbi:MAG: ATP-binding cassette domain-containing protein, partial [Gammaproteobacteria bacterium]|nr:ATP-binding cassette domain-containing protein [Gammaproteobacteria bacterium]
KVDEGAEILKLQDYMDRKPKALSGGQRQRVAIGRALVRGPEVFLFDEPLSNLDAELRVDMRVEIARLHREIGATMLYVTHDQVEAMTLADKIVVLRAGKVEQAGAPMTLYSDPDNKFVAGFIGSPSMNFVSPAALGLDEVALPSEDAIVGLRPENIVVDLNGCDLTVEIVERLGGVTYVHAYSESNEKLVIEHKSLDAPSRGDKIGIQFDRKDLYFFDAKTEKRIRV